MSRNILKLNLIKTKRSIMKKIDKLLLSTCFLLKIAVLSVSSSSAFAENSLKAIRFATEATYPPYVTMDQNGKIGGFETALIQALCNEAKLSCEFHHRPFDSLFPNLALKKIDAETVLSEVLFLYKALFVCSPYLNLVVLNKSKIFYRKWQKVNLSEHLV